MSRRTAVCRRNLRLTMTNVKSALVISTLIVIGTAAMYYVGSLHVLAGTFTLGALLVFVAYLVMLYQPLESLTYTAWAMEGATAGARRCFEILDRGTTSLIHRTPSRSKRRTARFHFRTRVSATIRTARSLVA